MNNLLENIREHFGRIVIFALLLLIILTLFIAFSHDPQMRIILLTFVTCAYIIYGLLHHHVQKELTIIKALEYITIAVFAAVGIGVVLGWGWQ